MTDLSTKHIQRLLAEATPGPWVRHPESPRVLSNLERKFAVHVELTRNGKEPQPEDVANTELIALAPPLAQEVLRLRSKLAVQEAAFLDIFPTDEELGDHDE